MPGKNVLELNEMVQGQHFKKHFPSTQYSNTTKTGTQMFIEALIEQEQEMFQKKS